MNSVLYKLPEPMRSVKFLGFIAIIIVVGGFLSLIAPTQYVAALSGYSDSLGKPILGRLYNPFLFVLWTYEFWDPLNPPAALVKGVVAFVISLFVCVVIPLILGVYVFRHSRQQLSDVHGSSRWATKDEIQQAGLLDDNTQGVYLGAWDDPHKKKRSYLTYNGDRHILAFAPSRSGKGIGLVLPSLYTWPHSTIVHDIKGENWALSSGYRQKHLNNVVIKFDPTCEDGSGACFNPLQEVRFGIKEVRDVQNLIGVIVEPDKIAPQEKHWISAAKSLLVGATLHVLYAEPNKTFRGILRLLSNPQTPIHEVLEGMLMARHDPQFKQGWIDADTGRRTYTHPVVAETAREMLNKSAEELSGVHSTATTFLTIYRDPVLEANTSRSDFSISSLMNHDKPVSLYIIVPPSDLGRTRSLVRILVNLISTRLLERMEFAEGRSVPHYKHRLLLMLDEFVSGFGQISSFEKALAYMAGYGIQAYLIIQDLSQLYGTYTRDESIISNCHLRIAFAPNKIETAELISRMAGVTTVRKYSKNVSGKRVEVVLHNISEGEQETQRPLITPDEVMRLSDDQSLIFVGNMFPINGRKIRYYEDPAFSARSKIPPPKISDKLPGPTFPSNILDANALSRIAQEEKSDESLDGLDMDLISDEDDKNHLSSNVDPLLL